MGYHYISGAIVPSGTIAIWHGLLANIPAGWVLCDGDNDTPDLREKFIQGTADGVDPGGEGGSLAKTMTVGGVKLASNIAIQADGGLDVAGLVAAQTHADIRPPYYEIAFIMKT